MGSTQDERRDFFISHASTDQQWAEWVGWILEADGWTVELDVWDWPPGHDFVVRMTDALQRARQVLALLSEDYFDRPHARAEWNAAFRRNLIEPGRLIPVVIAECDVPTLYATLVQIRLAGLDEAAAARTLVDRLRHQRPTQRPPYPADRAVPPPDKPDKPDYPGPPEPGRPGTRPAALRQGRTPPRHPDPAARPPADRPDRGRAPGDPASRDRLGRAPCDRPDRGRASGDRPGRAPGDRPGRSRTPADRPARTPAGRGAGPSVGVGVRRLWEGGRRHPRRVAAVAAGLVATAVLALAGPPLLWDDPAADCPQPTELRGLASPDVLATARAVTDAYARDSVDSAGCRTVHFFVYAPVGTTRRALFAAIAGGWRPDGRTDPARDIGPRPDVWFAESHLDVMEVEHLPAPGTPISGWTSIGSSPLVAGVAGAAGRGAASWSTLLPRLAADGGLLLRADPDASAAGDLTTLATYGELAGPDRRRADQLARASRDGVGESVGATGTELLCNRRRAAAADFAVITSEQAVLRYGDGLELSPDCGPVGDGTRPARPVVVRPVGSYLLDYPMVRFSWTAGARATTAVGALRSWLTGERGRRELAAQRLRPPSGAGPGAPPTRAEVAAARETYRAAQEPARVLLVVDTSGSMATAVAGSNRLAVAVAGVRESLDLMGVQDRFALWRFPADRAGGHRVLVPFGPGGLARRQAAEAALRAVRPAGRTPLYRAVADAVAAVRAERGSARAVVVLTDGEDTGSTPAPAEVAATARLAGVPVFVVAAGEARCTGGPLAVLATRCLQTQFGTVERTLTQLLGTLWGGR